MKLTNLICKNAKPREKPYKMSDGGGMYLLIQPTGSKLWRLAYRYRRRQRTLAFGVYPIITLAEARSRRHDAKRLLAHGIDPSAEKRRREREGSFSEMAEQWFAKWSPGKSADHTRMVETCLKNDINPEIGSMKVDEVRPGDIIRIVNRAEGRGSHHIAKRNKQIVGRVFRFAIALGIATTDPSASIGDAMQAPPRVKHRTSLRAEDLPDFLRTLARCENGVAPAIRLILLTWVRTVEIRFARWEEFERLDSETPLWRIPATRMKMHREHLVPLSPAAVSALMCLGPKSSGFLFPARTKTGVLNPGALLECVYDLGYKGKMTVHGLRGTASTLANEHGWNRDWIERQLAHVEENKIRGAYNSADYMSGRREMMEWWGQLIGKAERDSLADGDEFAALL